MLKDGNSFGILHTHNHYCTVLGFASFPDTPEDPEGTKNRWVFMADPSPDNAKCQIRKQHWSISPPIWSIRWGQLREDFVKNRNQGIIVITRNS